MKRKTLEYIVAAVAAGLALILLIIGIVMTSNANFANNYVHSQLKQQAITFKKAADLTPEERKAPCLVKYAGQQMTTGDQAECYANKFIALHLKTIGGGKTYAELGNDQTELRARIAPAQKDGSASVPDLQRQLADLTTQRETVFRGETLRGLLLTSFGFSEFGVKARQAALVSYTSAGLLALVAIAFAAHAMRTPATVAFAPPARPKEEEREE